MTDLVRPSLNWLLVLIPVAVYLRFTSPDNATMIFLAAALSILPLAAWLGKATEHLAHHLGEGIGALLNATFGNAAELIIALMALQKGLHGVVKASLTGSIIGNVLLVLGLSMVAGGMKFKCQKFNRTAASTQATMLIPAAFHHIAPRSPVAEGALSLEISIVLLVTYALSLVFTLVTHAAETQGEKQEAEGEVWSKRKAVAVLAGATALIAWVSEILVGSVEAAAESFGMTSLFVGVVVVAIIGNAAEHSTAVLMAMKNRMDISVGIAVGSSTQVALFVAPVLILLSRWIGPRPMDLVFTPAEVLAVTVSVFLTAQIASDGESNWMEGVQLLAVYAILGALFYFLPELAGATH